MISRKVCLLGAARVGKTSLAQRYIYSCFSEDYLSTIGVKLHKKSLCIDETSLDIVLWDVQGEDRYDKVLVSFLKGMSGYILVVDSTQPTTVPIARNLKSRVQENFGNLPYVLAYSKCDLPENPQTRSDCAELEQGATCVVQTSALNGSGVDQAFYEMARSILPSGQKAA